MYQSTLFPGIRAYVLSRNPTTVAGVDKMVISVAPAVENGKSTGNLASIVSLHLRLLGKITFNS